VTFRFAVLDFASPAENRYAYRLEGVDADWVVTRTSFARYPRLEPGNYTFRVRGASSDGVWSRETVELRLTIEPPFWQESWFLFLSFVAVVAGIYLAAQRRARRQLRFEKLERQVQTEREESRRRFVRELHDDISGELGSVVFALERYGRKDHIPEADRKELLGYWHRLRGLFEFFRDAIWVLESKNDTLRGLIERIETTTYQFFDDGRAFFHGPESVPDVRVSMDQRQHIFLIGKEALHNALKYARATRVEVDVIYEAGVFTLSVRDDGAGFDPVRTQEGQGFLNMRERAEALQATWTLESALGAGTRVELVVKIP
jgi:signal transduction histidine kinase